MKAEDKSNINEDFKEDLKRSNAEYISSKYKIINIIL